MFEVHEETTWWSPAKHTVIDARDIAMMGVTKNSVTEVYTLNIVLSGVGDIRMFDYASLAELNTALEPLGLKWSDDEVANA